MKNKFCEKCGISHPLQIMSVTTFKGRYIVEYRCRLTAYTIIKTEKDNPFNKKPSN